MHKENLKKCIKLFLKAGQLRPGVPVQIAKDLGLDVAKLETRIKAPETTAVILRDIQLGVKLNINATPTLFVNGHRMEGPFPIPAWIKIIDRLLSSSAVVRLPRLQSRLSKR